MAVTLKSHAQFFEAVFGVTHPITQAAKKLTTNGVVLTVSFYTCTAKIKGQEFTVNLTASSTALIKGTVDAAVLQDNKAKIANWITQLVMHQPDPTINVESPQTIPGTPFVSVVLTDATDVNLLMLIKTIRTVTGLSLGPAKNMAEYLKHQGSVTVWPSITKDLGADALVKFAAIGVKGHLGEAIANPAATWTPPVSEKLKPTSAVIQLREAKALGQKVKGTSTGSVYHTVAVNARIKVAARIHKEGSISIRAEWQNAKPTELKQLEDSGMQMKTNYASMHFNAGELPVARCIGAVVLGSGIEWDQAIMSAAELVVE